MTKVILKLKRKIVDDKMKINLKFFFTESQELALEAKYHKLNEKLELILQTTDFILLKMAPVSIMMPVLISTIFNYFANDLNDAAYVLPFPIL